MNRTERNELVEIDDCVCSIATSKAILGHARSRAPNVVS